MQNFMRPIRTSGHNAIRTILDDIRIKIVAKNCSFQKNV